jgi:hypothetical protein
MILFLYKIIYPSKRTTVATMCLESWQVTIKMNEWSWTISIHPPDLHGRRPAGGMPKFGQFNDLNFVKTTTFLVGVFFLLCHVVENIFVLIKILLCSHY